MVRASRAPPPSAGWHGPCRRRADETLSRDLLRAPQVVRVGRQVEASQRPVCLLSGVTTRPTLTQSCSYAKYLTVHENTCVHVFVNIEVTPDTCLSFPRIPPEASPIKVQWTKSNDKHAQK